MSEHAHREAQDLLPWLANGTLAGTELERVQAHLKGCAQCRADLAALHTLRAAAPPASFDLDMESALARLLPQLDAPASAAVQPAALPQVSAPPQAAALPARGWRARLAANDARWLRVAAGVQCCAIVVLAALLLRPGAATDASAGVSANTGAYHVLGAAPAAQTRLIVMFKPDTPERELRRIVLESGARIVGGPTATGAWVLGTEQAADAVAGRLRGQAAVTLAEPLGAEGRP
jgi:anti-sigma factor RsiW